MSEYVKMPKADYVAAADAIRSKTGKTDPIKSGDLATEIDSLSLGGGGGGAIDILLLEEQDLPFVLDPDLGYITPLSPAPFVLAVGETYRVMWDGTEYEVTAQDASALMPGAIFAGNGTDFGLDGNNEPFIMGYTDGDVLFSAFADPTETHKISVYLTSPALQEKTFTENGEYTADAGFIGLSKAIVNVAGASGSDRVTILPEQTITPTFSDNDGCYKASVSLSESPDEKTGYAVCFDGVWYIVAMIAYAADIGALGNTALQCFGNYAVRKKYYNYAIDWHYEESAKQYPFCFDSYGDVYLDNSENHTIRIDKIVITE